MILKLKKTGCKCKRIVGEDGVSYSTIIVCGVGALIRSIILLAILEFFVYSTAGLSMRHLVIVENVDQVIRKVMQTYYREEVSFRRLDKIEKKM